MNSTKIIISFIAGGITGAVFSYGLLKRYFKKISNDEIESVKTAYEILFKSATSKNDKTEEKQETESSTKREPYPESTTPPDRTVIEYLKQVRKVGYSGKTDMDIKDQVMDGGEEMKKRPYVIEPEDFGTLDYNIDSLTYYADGVLTDINDDIIDDYESLIGTDALNSFGKFEDDCVYVRNDELKTDYEILKDTNEYADVRRLYHG